jgi:VIT1/CCC1 family predicted Fe2+/Mn2+ transporter/rubrerythrin
MRQEVSLKPSTDRKESTEALISALQRNWRVEMEGSATYRHLAGRESDPRRKAILLRLADGEARHAERWAERLTSLGAPIPLETPTHGRWLVDVPGTDAALHRVEQDEEEHIRIYEEQARRFDDGPSLEIIRDAVRDEQSHANTLRGMTGRPPLNPKVRLDAILKREGWHTKTGSWFGDAIYGANDGLGAVFGIVSGVAGATTNSSHFVLLAGLAGAIASALSMGSGAYLATKSEGEIHRAEVERERNEVNAQPEEEIEELELFYQLKGLSPDEAKLLVSRIATDNEQLVSALAQEELGISEARIPNPLMSALSASVSTFFGAMIPVLPFFFLGGLNAVIVAAIVSLVAHFAVGASKTFVTGRSWVVSGGEMTIVGAVEGVVTYGIGILISPYTSPG